MRRLAQAWLLGVLVAGVAGAQTLELELTPAAREELIERGFSPDFGARHLASILERVCNVEIAKKLRRDDDGQPAG